MCLESRNARGLLIGKAVHVRQLLDVSGFWVLVKRMAR